MCGIGSLPTSRDTDAHEGRDDHCDSHGVLYYPPELQADALEAGEEAVTRDTQLDKKRATKEMRFHPASAIFPILDEQGLRALAEDIAANGQKEPVDLLDGTILDGRNRYLACLRAGVRPKFRRVEPHSPLEHVVSRNLVRRHLSESQRAAIAVELLPRLETEARERQRGGKGGRLLRAQLPEAKGRARDHAGRLVGVSPRYVEDAKTIKATNPGEFEAVKSGKKTLSEVMRELKRNEREAAKFNVPRISGDLLSTTFQVVLADPPWPYDNKIKQWGPAELHYPTMDLGKILELPRALDIKIDDRAALFLWVTNPFLAEGLRVAEAWGFEYKTNLVWVKHGLKRPGSGFYVRGRHELLFLSTRGSFTPPARLSPPIGSVIEAEVGEHSAKPDEQYELIERLYPGCNRLELFARKRREGWRSWGAEVGGTSTTAS